MDQHGEGLSDEELQAESATALPDKEVVSILDLNVDIDLAIDAAAPIDLAAAANLNVAAPIDAAVGANVLSVDSTAQALSDQGVIINQDLSADAVAHANQDSALDQSNDVPAAGDAAVMAAPASAGTGDNIDALADPSTGTIGDAAGAAGDVAGGAAGAVDGAGDAVGGATGTVGGVGDVTDGATGAAAGVLDDGNLLNVNVNVDADADIAAPIDGAVAANANVAAPIDGAVGANVGSVNSDAVGVAQQDAVINQHLDGSADATADQQSDIQQ
jgi:hypothetical protein